MIMQAKSRHECLTKALTIIKSLLSSSISIDVANFGCNSSHHKKHISYHSYTDITTLQPYNLQLIKLVGWPKKAKMSTLFKANKFL